MMVDGKQIATTIVNSVAEQIKTNHLNPKMVVITCAPNFETRKYLELKQKKADSLGIDLEVRELSSESNTADIVEAVKLAVLEANGVIVQLPLPASIDTSLVLAAVPASHDVDAFSYGGEAKVVLPPVVGAIDEIARQHGVTWSGSKVVIFGEGRLVGKPAALYARAKGAEVTVITIHSPRSLVLEATLAADIVILGAGQPNLLTVDMVKDGVVVFDAGASEDGGLLVGDASPLVAQKASVFTPVPGGIGPITIALLYRNLLQLLARQ